MNGFRTIKGTAESLYKEKGSKFLGFACPARSEAEVKDHLDILKKQYHDARHHCFAYILGFKDQSYRAYDDGEPNHSAGNPILGKIRSKNLTNCLVVVVRYFGGTKLGVSRLINAYKTAAEEALDQAEIITVYSQTKFRLLFGYEQTSEIERILNEFEIDYLEKRYAFSCEFVGLLKDEKVKVLDKKLELIKGVEISFQD